MKLALVCVAVASPVPVMVTLAVAVAVDPPGAYCTSIVQLLPGLTTKPLTQVPPVGIENVPPAVPTLLTVGDAVNVKGPFAAAALVTVIVPVFVVVLAGAVVSTGAGALSVTVAPVTVNPPTRAGVVPIGVVTDTFLAVVAAVAAIVQFAVTVVDVGVPVIAQATPGPDTLTAVAPVRFVPVSVTGTVVPISPDSGETSVRVGPRTVKVSVLLVPDPVVMLTVLAVRPAPAEMVKVTCASLGLKTVRPLTVIPPPDTLTAVAPVKFAPWSDSSTAEPRTPVGGAIEVSVGAGRATTVNGTALLVPPGAVTVTFLALPVAPGEIAKVALT